MSKPQPIRTVYSENILINALVYHTTQELFRVVSKLCDAQVRYN